MAPRQRKDPRLPDGLRERDGYYSYTSPLDGREYGMGRDRRKAIQEAMEANAALKRTPTLIERITGAAKTWGEWCDQFEIVLFERDSKPNTQKTRRSQMKRLRAAFPKNAAAASIDTMQCSDVLKALKAEGKARTAQAFRSFMVDCFDRMIAQGWRKDNPARVTDKVTVKVGRSRLTLETYLALYRTTEIVWLRNAMALALVAGKDRDSVRNAKFSDFRDGGWWNERSKTGMRVFLPMNVRLNVIGLSLDDVLKQCRTTGIISPYLIHQTQRAKGARLGKALHPDMITRRFSEELAKLNLNWGDKEPPTFHEIRSLAARLHAEQGSVNPQELLSHKDPKSTATYTDGRGEWLKLTVKS